MRLTSLILAIFCLIFTWSSSVCMGEEAEKEEDIEFAIGVNVGSKTYFWEPSAWTKIVWLDTAGFSGYNIDLSAEYNKTPFFIYKYERPFSGVTSQEKMLDENRRSASGIERYSWGVLFKSIVEFLKPENTIIKNIASARVVSFHETYSGNLSANKSFIYVVSGSQVQPLPDGSILFYGGEEVEAGASLAFKTQFRDTEITFAWPSDDEERRFDYRLGYFESEWYKPSAFNANWFTVEEDLPVLFESVYRSKGVMAGVETIDHRHSGLNGNFSVRYGLENSISSVVSQFQENTSAPLHGSVFIDVWYNWYPMEDNKKAYITFGASYDRRLWATKIDPIVSSEFPFFFYNGAVDADTIFKLYGMMGF